MRKIKYTSDNTIQIYPYFRRTEKLDRTLKQIIDSQESEILDVSTLEKENKKYSSTAGHCLSLHSKRKIKRQISSFSAIEFKYKRPVAWSTFTVTDKIDGSEYIPQTDDKIVLEAFKKFLVAMRQRLGLLNYLWVAERQDGKRNNYESRTNKIHFHAVLVFEKEYPDVRLVNLLWLYELNKIGFHWFMNKDAILDKWNNERSYYDRKKDKNIVIPPYKNQGGKFEQFYKKIQVNHSRLSYSELQEIVLNDLLSCTGKTYTECFDLAPTQIDLNIPRIDFTANPFDVKKLKDWKSVTNYITKYITKQDENDLIYCRLWGSTRGFSSLETEMELFGDEVDDIIEDSELVYKTYSTPVDINGRQYEFITIKLTDKFFETALYARFLSYLEVTRTGKEQKFHGELMYKLSGNFMKDVRPEIQNMTTEKQKEIFQDLSVNQMFSLIAGGQIEFLKDCFRWYDQENKRELFNRLGKYGSQFKKIRSELINVQRIKL